MLEQKKSQSMHLQKRQKILLQKKSQSLHLQKIQKILLQMRQNLPLQKK